MKRDGHAIRVRGGHAADHNIGAVDASASNRLAAAGTYGPSFCHFELPVLSSELSVVNLCCEILAARVAGNDLPAL